jgi:hypothetical protein
MNSISSTSSSAGEALVSLLRSGSTVNEAAPKGTGSSNQLSSSRTPVDVVDLSDRAQAVLARAKIEKVAADRLAAQVQATRGADKSAGTKSTRSDASNLYETLSGSAVSKSTSGPTIGNFDELTGYLDALKDDNRNPDGTANSFTKTVNDFFTAPPSTPQEMSDWYKDEEARAAVTAADEPDPIFRAQAQAYLQAVKDRNVTIVSAKDIPELNFHNTWTLQGGEGGCSINATSTYNHDASIFKDPNTTYFVGGAGTVIVWKHPSGDTASSS